MYAQMWLTNSVISLENKLIKYFFVSKILWDSKMSFFILTQLINHILNP